MLSYVQFHAKEDLKNCKYFHKLKTKMLTTMCPKPNMQIFLLKLINQETSYLKIDLNQLKSCQINRKTRDYKKEKKMETELQSLDLELILKNETVTLHFYNTNDQFSEDMEMKRAEKWKTLIEQRKPKSISQKKTA